MPDPIRDTFWAIPGWSQALLYAAVVATAVAFVLGLRQRLGPILRGRPAPERLARWPERARRLAEDGLLQVRTFRRRYPGLAHGLTMWGFLLLFLGTTLVFLDHDFGLAFLRGRFYLGFELVLDLAGVGFLVGLALFTVRRYGPRPASLVHGAADGWILLLLFALGVGGFLLEAIRLAVVRPPWAAWSPVGQALATLLVAAGLEPGTLRALYLPLWWAHAAMTFGMIALLPFSKLLHLLSAPANVALRSLEPAGQLPGLDLEASETFGITTIEDLSWKSRLDLYACTECGRCQDACPAWATGKPLSPMRVILDLRQELRATERPAFPWAAGAIPPPDERPLAGGVIAEDVLWACTTCGACQEVCPVHIEHIEKIVGMRRNLVLMESRFPAEVQLALQNFERNFNPWALGWEGRADWARDLGVPRLADGARPDVLFWVGCAGAFADRNKQVSRALVRILQAAGIDFAILGTEEKCTGDPARRIGNEYLFQMLARENVETLNRYGVRRIVTTCPHCFNTLKSEYPAFGGRYEVTHHSAFIAELLRQGRLRPAKPLDRRLVYHDSCYLSRHNGVIAEPRAVLAGVAGLRLVEAPRAGSASFCCGAGGGRMFMEEKLGTRVNLERTEELLGTVPDVVATACPFCLTMLGDGLKAKAAAERVESLDLAEIVERAL
jgi:Fe-S oxidoreductase/nitrate reductase gamma subunit